MGRGNRTGRVAPTVPHRQCNNLLWSHEQLIFRVAMIAIGKSQQIRDVTYGLFEEHC